jgi:hypothetical protein
VVFGRPADLGVTWALTSGDAPCWLWLSVDHVSPRTA